MTQQNPLSILQAFSPSAQEITGQFQAGQNVLTQGLQRDLMEGQLQQQKLQTQGLEQQANIQNTVSRLQEIERQIGFGATPQQLEATLQGFIQESQARGGNPIDSQQALQALQTGGVEGLSNILGQAKQVFQQQGLIAAPQTEKAQSAFAKIDPSKFTPESVAAFEQTGRFAELKPVSVAQADPEFIKELRGELRKDVGKLQTEATTLKTNFGKLQGLADEMRKGNRSAVAQGLVSLVKLGDPGSVVREEELKQALGAQKPAAAVADVLRGKGVGDGIINSVVQSLDPLNPAAVNVDQVLATAQAMLRPNIESITGAYNTARGRAAEQLTEGGVRSIFSKGRDELFSEVGALSFGAGEQPMTEAREEQEVEQAPVRQTFYNNTTGEAQEFELINNQWVPVGG